MPKLISTLSEGLALRGLCSKDKVISGHLLANLSEAHFRTDQAREAYKYILTAIQKTGVQPTYRLMLESARLSTDTKEFLRENTQSPASLDQVKQIVTTLNDYRRAYIFYSLSKDILTEVEQKKMNLDGLIETAIAKLSEIQTGRDVSDTTYHFGLDSNAEELVHEIVHGELNDQIIPTGYKPWDDTNGGFPRGSLVCLGGATGAGKSHNVIQLGINMARAGYKVTVVPLEMSHEATTTRMLANLSGIDSLKIMRRMLATDEKALVEEKYKKFNARVARKGGRYTVFKPGSSITLEALFASLHTYQSDVIIIDYIGLLEGADGDDQWRKLGSMARYAAVYADVHNKVVVLMAQVNEEGRLRYSQAVKEHSSILWSFVANKESREQGFLKYTVGKSRTQDSKSFVMGIDYALSRIYYNGETEQAAQEDQQGDKKGKTGKASSKSDMMPDLTD